MDFCTIHNSVTSYLGLKVIVLYMEGKIDVILTIVHLIFSQPYNIELNYDSNKLSQSSEVTISLRYSMLMLCCLLLTSLRFGCQVEQVASLGRFIFLSVVWNPELLCTVHHQV